MNVFAYQLSAPLSRGPYKDLAHWWKALALCPFTGSVERALWSGFHADRLGYAFVGGYTAALARLVEVAGKLDRPLPARLSLCATEKDGAHPRTIRSTLDRRGGALVLNGEKTFATLASEAEELLVVASRGASADGKNRLRVVRVNAKAKGVTIKPRPETPFTPEIPHAVVTFTDVVVENDQMLAGDGYDAWLKPFRTIEDIHVMASMLGYLSGAARAHGFARDVSCECVSLGLALVDVAAREPEKPLTHVVLNGIIASARRLVGALGDEWTKAPADERERWQRDMALLLVAENARGKRTDAALATYATPSPSQPDIKTC